MNYEDRFDRVRSHSAAKVNNFIDRLTDGNIIHFARQDDGAIYARLAELDREWDVDRAVMASFSILGGATFGTGLLKNRGWLYVFGSQMAFLLYHSVRGWCPPAAIFRRMGFRTRMEIDRERESLLDVLAQRQAAAAVEELDETVLGATADEEPAA